jgi:uncharacterized protein YodC (DUF2158 family)
MVKSNYCNVMVKPNYCKDNEPEKPELPEFPTASEQELKVGDVVRLRSGGLCMTIHTIKLSCIENEPPDALFEWFDGAKFQGGGVITTVLERAEPFTNSGFRVGDVVCLKSGGPAMTVYRVDIRTPVESECACVWMNYKGPLQFLCFLNKVLKAV